MFRLSFLTIKYLYFSFADQTTAVNSGIEDINGLSGGLGEVAEPHGHRQVQLSGAPVRRELDLHFRSPGAVSGKKLRLGPVLAGQPREQVERLPAFVRLGPGATGLVGGKRAGLTTLLTDFLVFEVVLFGAFSPGQLLDSSPCRSLAS